MRRREFITLLGGATVWPLPLRAQQQRPVIGFLGTVAQELWVKPVAAFEERLREHGWIDGRTIKIIYRWAEGRPERFAEIATEFVNSNVDVIVTGGNAVSAARQATSTIPIVFALAVDPVGSGFVNSLSRPGGNVTGLSSQGPDLAARACPRSPPIGNTGQRRLSSGQRRIGAGSNSGARTRVGICCFGNTARRGHSACLRRGKRPCGCFVCRWRSFSDRKCGSNHQIGPGCRVASHIQQPRVRSLRRPHSLWAKLPRTVSACGGRRGQNTSWSQASRHPRSAAD